jgi:hypothetical protein
MLKHLFIAVLLTLVAACGSTPDWDYDTSVEFANYKTFAWSEHADIKNHGNDYQINDLMEKRIRKAIVDNLAAQGIKFVDAKNADVLVNYHASVDQKLESDTMQTTYSARWNYWGWGYQTQTTTREYDVGTLVVDIVDAKSNQLVWRGAKEGRLRKKQTPEQRTEAINKTIAEILKNFPPKPQH